MVQFIALTLMHYVDFCTALYFIAVAAISAIVGQHIVRKLIDVLGRASLIIFVLAFTILVSAVSLGRPCDSLLIWFGYVVK